MSGHRTTPPGTLPGLRDALHGPMRNVTYNHALLTIHRLWPRRHEGWHERVILRRAVSTVRGLRV